MRRPTSRSRKTNRKTGQTGSVENSSFDRASQNDFRSAKKIRSEPFSLASKSPKSASLSHYCPVEWAMCWRNGRGYWSLGRIFRVLDFNLALHRSSFFLSPVVQEGLTDERRPFCVCSVNGSASQTRLSAMRRSVSGQLPTAAILLPGSISGDGLCATDLSRELAGRRDLLESHGEQALSRRLSLRSVSSMLSPSCICGLEIPKSVGRMTKPWSSPVGLGTVTLARSMGNRGSRGVSR